MKKIKIVLTVILISCGAQASNFKQFFSSESKVTYLGLTSSSYSGSGVGGWIAANAKCVTAFGAGARMMTLRDFLDLSRAVNMPGAGWFDCRDGIGGNSNFACAGTSGGNGALSCSDWTSTSNTYSGAVIDVSGTVATGSCNVSRPIHCVR